MHRSSTVPAASSSNGPLRRNQACHQCRARKLKCDAGRPCSTCKRSHAKAIASLTSSGQAVSTDPCCTYDYAPGEDPWTATLRNGLGLPPPMPRGRSGSVSPGGSSNDAQVAQAMTTSSNPLPSSMPPAGPLRVRHAAGTRRRSPPYASPGRTAPVTHGSAYDGSPPSVGTLTSSGAHDGFLSPPPSLIDVRGLPAFIDPVSLPAMPPYISPHSSGHHNQEFQYEEMVDMLYNPMGPFFDPPALFSPLPSYVNPLLDGEYPGSEAPLYAHDNLGSLSLDSGVLDPSSNMSRSLGNGASATGTGDMAAPLRITMDGLSPRHRGATR